jgi:hypothetical protein
MGCSGVLQFFRLVVHDSYYLPPRPQMMPSMILPLNGSLSQMPSDAGTTSKCEHNKMGARDGFVPGILNNSEYLLMMMGGYF